MKKYHFSITVVPSWTDFTFDDERTEFAEGLTDAKKRLVEYLCCTYNMTFSKTAIKRPKKLFRDIDGKSVQTGFVCTAGYDGMRAFVFVEINEMVNPFKQ